MKQLKRIALNTRKSLMKLEAWIPEGTVCILVSISSLNATPETDTNNSNKI
jgi:hypothetical protein